MRALQIIGKPLSSRLKAARSRLWHRHGHQKADHSPLSTCGSDIAIELNPSLDKSQLAESFRQNGRIHIPGFLTDASAWRLHYALERETPWGLIFNEGKKVKKFKRVSPKDHQAMLMAAWERAHTDFQYIYHYYRLSERRDVHPGPDHYLRRLVDFLSAPQLYAFIRDITGMEVNSLQSSTATLFNPLHFLTRHDDGDQGEKRLVAFSLNMTPEWRPDWGGALQFFDGKDHIEDGYLPTFNGLNLFRVPMHHSVSQVAAFGGARYSVSGWFEAYHAEPKPNGTGSE